MSDPITWYALGRDVYDPETIMEAIDAKLLTHNMDPSAHGQSDESVYNHRSDATFDHVNYSIYNFKISPSVRYFKAICDSGGAGDFVTIQAAIDYAHLHGGGRVLVHQGTYNLTSDIILYSNIILQGDDKELTILNFGDDVYHIKAIGAVGSHLRNIELHDLQVRKQTIWEEVPIDFQYVDDVEITRCKFYYYHNTDSPQNWTLQMQNCIRATVEDNYFDHCDNCINFIDCDYSKAQGNRFDDIYNSVFYCVGSNNCFFRENLGNNLVTSLIKDSMIYFGGTNLDLLIDANIFHNINKGAIWNETASRVTITNNIFEAGANGYWGIGIVDISKTVISGNRITGFEYTGISLDADSNDNTITGNVSTNNGTYGVDIGSASCNRNVVVANALYGNSSGPLNDAGTGTVKDHNSS